LYLLNAIFLANRQAIFYVPVKLLLTYHMLRCHTTSFTSRNVTEPRRWFLGIWPFISAHRTVE